MNDKSHVGFQYAICPMCGTEHNVGLLLDRRRGILRITLKHKTITHYEPCPDCLEKLDAGFVCLVEARDDGKDVVKVHEPHRTGRMMWLKKDAADAMFIGKEVKTMCFINDNLYDALEEIAEETYSRRKGDCNE